MNYSPAKHWAGDLLLLFDHRGELPRGRMDAPWQPIHNTPIAQLYASQTTPAWRGSPITHWRDDGMLYWLLGETWGERTSPEPHNWPGHFLLLGLNNEDETWHLWTNRCGTFHAYYGSGGEYAALGTYSPAVVAGTTRTQDIKALAGFFSFGFFPSDRTYYEEVRIIRPATHLVLDRTGKVIKEERTWQWFHEPDPTLSFDQAVDQFAGIFHQVIREQLSGRRVAFPISGGLDSRSTIAALPQEDQGQKPWSFSYGYSYNSVETRIAAKIAKTRQLPYTRYTIEPYLFDRLQLVVDSVEGFQDVTQCRQAFVVDELANQAEYVMAAHWGDVWLDDMGYSDHLGSDWLEYTTKKFHKNGDWLDTHIIKELLPNLDTPSYLRETLAAEAQQLAHLADPDFRLKALKTELWSFRWTTASIRMYQPGAFPLLPFYDPRLVDFFCTVPTGFVAGRRLQIEYIKRYAPDLARITWQAFDANLYWYRYYKTLLLPKRVARKITRSLSNKPLIQRNWEVQFLSPGGRSNLEDRLLSDGLKICDFVKRERVDELIRTFYAAPTPKDGYTLSMLLTFATWLEHYA